MPEDTNVDVQQHDSTHNEAQEAVIAGSEQANGQEPIEQSDTQDDGGSQTHEGKHPLEPGGKRFDQVYARAKDAEARLHAEREAKARLEGELEALRKQPPSQPTTPRYNATQLQALIDEGKATVGQVLAYQQETMQLEAARLVDQRVDEKLATITKHTTVQTELARYRQAVPNVDVPGSEERIKVEREYSYLVSMGYDPKDPRTEILAARAAFGDPETAKQRHAARTIPTQRDTMQDTTSNGKPKPDAKDPLTALTGEQRKHYQKMIDRGVYKGWGEVKEELAFVPPR